MTIALIAAILNAFAAVITWVSNHPGLCVFHAVMAVILTLDAISYEGRMLNRIKKLEEEIDILKGRFL